MVDTSDDDIDPSGWPVTGAVVLLRGEAERDRQVARLLADLHALEDGIATLPGEPDAAGVS